MTGSAALLVSVLQKSKLFVGLSQWSAIGPLTFGDGIGSILIWSYEFDREV